MAALGCRTARASSRGDGGHFYPSCSPAAHMHDPYWLEDDDILACVPLDAAGEGEELTMAGPLPMVALFSSVSTGDTATMRGNWGSPGNLWAPLQMDAALPNPFQDVQQLLSPGSAPLADLDGAAGCWLGGMGDICSDLSVTPQAAPPSGLWMPRTTERMPALQDFSPCGHIAEALCMHRGDDLDSFSASTACSSPQQPFSLHGASHVAAARSASSYSDQDLLWAPERWPEPCMTQPDKARGACTPPRASSRQAPRRGRREAPPGGLERSRDVQRRYLQRKRVKVDAMHARLDSLKERKALLERSVAPLLREYVARTSGCSLHQMQEEAKFLASIGTGVHSVLATMHEASSGPDAPPANLFTLLPAAAQLDSCGTQQGAPGTECAASHAARSLVARLRMTKKQRDVLVEQTAEARKQVAELRSERSRLAVQLQGLATHWLSAAAVPWLSATMSAQLMVGQLCGLASREQYLTASLLLACMAAVSSGQQALLTDSVVATRMDVYALCLEMIISPQA